MAYLKVENVRITGISAGVPKHAEGSVSTTDKYGAEDFVQTTGIKEKRYDERLTTSDLGLPAAEKLIADLGWDKKEIGCIGFSCPRLLTTFFLQLRVFCKLNWD